MSNNLINKGKKYFMNTYAQLPIVFEKGEGVYLYDTDGKKYIDFVAGIAVNCLGYGNDNFISAISQQLNKLNHVSNLYWNEPAINASEKLIKYSGLDKVFFCNSGTEAIEAAIKLCRLYGKQNKSDNAFEIITMKKSFHGRTMGAITATGQEKYQKNLNPLLEGFKYSTFNDIEEFINNINDNTCAVIIEPIQGEGGINPAEIQFLKKVREICSKENIVLVFDEVQSGIGRTGNLFAYQYYNITPDIVTTAKGLGNGIPVGAIIASEDIADAFTPGTHASTFGGNAIACTATSVVIDELMINGLIENVEKQGKYLKEKLIELLENYPCIKEVRGIGLMQGIELDISVSEIISKCIDKGLLLVSAGTNVIRFVPPLIINKSEIDEGISILKSVLEEI